MPRPKEDGLEEALVRSDTIYEVVYQGQPIGRSRLEGHDVSMGVASGAFDPLPAYLAVQPVFLLFAQAEESRARGEAAREKEQLSAYYQDRDALQLTLQTAEGRPIPSNMIHIVDFGEVGQEVVVHISDPAFWHERDTC